MVEFRTKGTTTTTRYLLAGNNWNTEATTDELGNITRTYLVDPFGTFKVYTGAGVDGKWFTSDDVAGDPTTLEGERVLQGLPWYGSTGLYHLRNRWYSPTLQRFLSLDPLGFDAGDANLYRFEGNDPLGNLDPMGARVTRAKAVNAALTGLGVGTATGLAARTFPRFSRGAGVLAIPLGLYAAGRLMEKAAEIYTGMESGTMRKLCPQEIEAREDDLLLGSIENVFGAVGAVASAPLYKGIVALAGKFTALGEEIVAAEALSGLEPRAGDEPLPPTAGSTDGTSGGGQRTFTSDDPGVAQLANEIEATYPGHVKGVNVPLYRPDGTVATDADILLQNAVLQVKSGGGTGLTSQLLRTQAVTDLPVIGYGPNLGGTLIRNIGASGGLVTRDKTLLIQVIAP